MISTKKTVESKTKIRFPDCDPFNHLNNSKYIDYMILAREDQLLEHYGFDVYRLAKEEGVGWVLAQTQIAYLYPAFLMEEVSIETRLLAASDKSLLLEALMWNSDKSILKSLMWARLVHVDLRQQKPLSHSTSLMQFFSTIVCPMSGDAVFEERVKNMKMAQAGGLPAR